MTGFILGVPHYGEHNLSFHDSWNNGEQEPFLTSKLMTFMANSEWSRFQGLRITLSNQALGDSGAHNTVPYLVSGERRGKLPDVWKWFAKSLWILICVLYRSL